MDNTSVFLTISKDHYIVETDSFFVIRDSYPVSPGHSLIITKQVRKDYFELTKAEQLELIEVINLVTEKIRNEFSPDGFNIGMNCGATAGQTVFHFHCHIIPRYTGDMADPRGGVRHCIEGRGYY
jgi:diadenosine tetraphosphate (Ap4A) HIT family hydrolase